MARLEADDPVAASVKDLGRFLAKARPSRKLPLWSRYLLATLMVLITLGVRFAVADVLVGYPFILFFPAIVASAVLFDRGTGIYASILSAAVARYFFMEPSYSFVIEDAGTGIAITVFLLVSVLIAVLIEALRTSVARLTTALDHVRTLEQQKTMLLTEVHHRVKNNLNTVSSLLLLQSQNASDQSAPEALRSAAARVSVIGRLHDRLAYADESTLVDIRGFLLELCEDLRRSLVEFRPVSLQVAADKVPLQLNRAIAVGLIVNELVTNALKYAFTDGRTGTVTVNLRQNGHELVLTVSDDGVGISTDRRIGTGTRIISALARQLGGSVTPAEDVPGSSFSVTFPKAE